MERNTLTTRHVTKYQSGVSLIELMIGMVIGLVLLGGILQTMLASKEAAATRQSISTITDNARFLFDFMARDLRMGGRGYDSDVWKAAWPEDSKTAPLPIEMDDGVLVVRYLDQNNDPVEVRYQRDNNEVEYQGEVDGQFEPLIGGVDALDFNFACFNCDGDNTTDDYEYSNSPAEWGNVTAVEITVRFIDEDPWGGQDQAIDAKQISSTVALRNQVSRLITP